MRTETVTYKIYKFEELSDEVKAKVLDNNRDWHMDYEWWDYTVDYWKEILEVIGFCDAKIYFSGFSSQGDGACFDANLDIDKLVSTLAYYGECDYKRFRDLRTLAIANEFGWVEASIRTTDHHYNHAWTRTVEHSLYGMADTPILTRLEDILEEIEELRLSLCREIYKSLEQEYTYLTSDEAITESLEANETEFYNDGTIY